MYSPAHASTPTMVRSDFGFRQIFAAGQDRCNTATGETRIEMRLRSLARAGCCLLFLGSIPVAAQSPTRTISLQSMDHVALNVSSLEKSAEWYRRVLGFRIVHKWTTTWMVGRRSMRLGLFLRPNATPVPNTDTARVIAHFAFKLDAAGFKRAIKILRDMSIPFDDPEDTGIAQSIFLSDPDGYQVELTTYYK
jgi:catechol 2,3-dioxygenase-like lactoylglutathione lyase family enzyme